MVFGNPVNERLQLNEETVWIGERRDRNNPQAGRTPEVRNLLMAGKVREAEALAAQVMMGVPDRLPCYRASTPRALSGFVKSSARRRAT